MSAHLPDDDHDEQTPPGEPTGVDGAEIGFAQLGLRTELLDALTRLGYEEPTPIQAETIPLLMEGRDLLGQAATGTGKTAAFALPVLERVGRQSGRVKPVALVLVPTRELAMQVSEAIYRYGRGVGALVVPIYGGQPIGRQLQALSRGVHVVVATPGRALDHIRRKSLPLDSVEIVVLDEADEMLDMGFAEDLEAILEATPAQRQTVLFSATMPSRIDGMARRHLRDPVRVKIQRPTTDAATAPLVRQSAYIVSRGHKPAALGRVLDVEGPGSTIVFCRTRVEVDQLAETLNGRGYRAEALHGGMSQEQRDRAMGRLRHGTADLLIATDVAARGLDIDQLTHVVNYDVPSAPEAYVHRIGRVGRAGREGVAITLAEPREQRLLANIERVTKQKIAVERVPTVADLRARQLELTLGALRETLAGDDLEPYRSVIDPLTVDFELEEVALAAVKLAHEATVPKGDDQEIPEIAIGKDHKKKHGKDKDGATSGGKHGGKHDAGKHREGKGKEHKHKGRPDRDRDRDGSDEVTRIWIGLGRDSGIRPQDLVGAIANETRLSGRDIGAITIKENYSIVEVPEKAVDEVTWALKRTTVKGKKAKTRRYRD